MTWGQTALMMKSKSMKHFPAKKISRPFSSEQAVANDDLPERAGTGPFGSDRHPADVWSEVELSLPASIHLRLQSTLFELFLLPG